MYKGLEPLDYKNFDTSYLKKNGMSITKYGNIDIANLYRCSYYVVASFRKSNGINKTHSILCSDLKVITDAWGIPSEKYPYALSKSELYYSYNMYNQIFNQVLIDSIGVEEYEKKYRNLRLFFPKMLQEIEYIMGEPYHPFNRFKK